MENQITTMKNELAVHQQKQSMTLAIQKAGGLTERNFFENRSKFKKLCHLTDEEASLGISIIFTRLAVFTGLKERIDTFIKQDIANGLMTNHRHLSLEEIEYAFCLDRDGMYGEDPTPHYQFINREYVGKVLRKYNKWIERKREDFRINRY